MKSSLSFLLLALCVMGVAAFGSFSPVLKPTVHVSSGGGCLMCPYFDEFEPDLTVL